MRTRARFLWLAGSLLVLVLTLLACGLTAPAATPAPAGCAGETEPTAADIQYALDYTGDTFAGAEWERSYGVRSLRVNVTWLNETANGLAYLERLVYSCGYTQADIDTYFSETNFTQIIFADYENVRRLDRCEGEAGLTLHEFSAQSSGSDYHIRYWVRPDTETRVLALLLAFPADRPDLMDAYARALFPELSLCTGLN